jgi:hypothetical protein
MFRANNSFLRIPPLVDCSSASVSHNIICLQKGSACANVYPHSVSHLTQFLTKSTMVTKACFTVANKTETVIRYEILCSNEDFVLVYVYENILISARLFYTIFPLMTLRRYRNF